MKILLIDNYDSFTYNIKQMLENLGAVVDVFRNNQIDYDQIDTYDGMVLSPGPGVPDHAGDLKNIIRKRYKTKPILGICLGMQAIGEVFSCRLKQMEHPLHGHATSISHTQGNLFRAIPETFTVGRYHSWVIDQETLSDPLVLTAVDQEGQIMGIQLTDYQTYGVQFHPESIMTEYGQEIMSNFLNQIK